MHYWQGINITAPTQCSSNWCYSQTSPITNGTVVPWFPKSLISIVETNIQSMSTHVTYLNITHLSELRIDAHPSVYTTNREGKPLTMEQRHQPIIYADCSHWCLPGLPDTWNVLLLASLMRSPADVHLVRKDKWNTFLQLHNTRVTGGKTAISISANQFSTHTKKTLFKPIEERDPIQRQPRTSPAISLTINTLASQQWNAWDIVKQTATQTVRQFHMPQPAANHNTNSFATNSSIDPLNADSQVTNSCSNSQ